jgi:hypothetical protein
MSYPNIARGRRAWQSSIGPWSKGTIEEDASGAVNGDPTKSWGFHTNGEANPWWAVDLAEVSDIREIHIYNRKSSDRSIQLRASPIVVETSIDGETWVAFHRTEPGFVFGDGDGQNIPLVCTVDQPRRGRYVRITVPSQFTWLHLAEVEVYGASALAPSASTPDSPAVSLESPEVAAFSSTGSKPKPFAAAQKSPQKRGWLSFLGW